MPNKSLAAKILCAALDELDDEAQYEVIYYALLGEEDAQRIAWILARACAPGIPAEIARCLMAQPVGEAVADFIRDVGKA